jgi:ATP-dependent Clp protease ATP-binding subunit ClpB
LVTTVVQRLVEGYDVNYGARSVMNEAQTLAIRALAESQIRGDIGKKYASYFICLFNISHVNRTNSWLVHLFINHTGDIDMAKEDPTRKLQYSVVIITLNIFFFTGRTRQGGCHYVL